MYRQGKQNRKRRNRPPVPKFHESPPSSSSTDKESHNSNASSTEADKENHNSNVPPAPRPRPSQRTEAGFFSRPAISSVDEKSLTQSNSDSTLAPSPEASTPLQRARAILQQRQAATTEVSNTQHSDGFNPAPEEDDSGEETEKCDYSSGIDDSESEPEDNTTGLGLNN
jgi:hypothetical protein